jgi:hypothetical protein
MSQKQRSLVMMLGALVVAGVLGGIAYQTQKSDEAKKAQDEKQAKLFDFDSSKVTGIKVTAKGQTTELSKQGERWMLTAPMQAEADAAAVDGVLNRMDKLKSKSVVEEHPTDVHKYGLDSPKADVVLTIAGAPSVELILGDENEFNHAQYAKKAGSDTVYLAEGGNAASLEKNTFDLRDKTVWNFKDLELTKIEARPTEGEPFKLQRDGDNWKMLEPKAQGADLTTVSQMLTLLKNLRALAIPEENPTDLAKYHLDHPDAEVTLTTVTPTSLRFGIVTDTDGKTKKLYAQRSDRPTIFQLPITGTDSLKQTPATLEDKTILHYAVDSVGAMQFTTPGGVTLLVQRKHTPASDAGPADETWTQMAPKPGEAKKWKLSGLMHNLASLRAAKVTADAPTDLKPYGLDAPRKKLVIQDSVGQALGEIWVGSESGANVYVKTPKDNRVFEVEKHKLAELPEGPDDLLNLPPATTAAKP